MIGKKLIVSATLCLAMTAHATMPIVIDVDSMATATLSDASSPAGIWQMRGDGAIFSIVPRAGHAESFDLYIIESPDVSIAENTHFGSMTRTGNGRQYDAAIYADIKGSSSPAGRKKHSLIFDFSADGSLLTIQPYSKGKRINLLRWLPYLFRISISDVDSRPKHIDGAHRLTPTPISQHITL
ncbi:MAG: hypothetical protein J1F05_08720 [Muribaculaceae bacterium]|nr:hypothetical protein [Muribaculaceae bacterium]